MNTRSKHGQRYEGGLTAVGVNMKAEAGAGVDGVPRPARREPDGLERTPRGFLE